jgi:hypothetical protein
VREQPVPRAVRARGLLRALVIEAGGDHVGVVEIDGDAARSLHRALRHLRGELDRIGVGRALQDARDHVGIHGVARGPGRMATIEDERDRAGATQDCSEQRVQLEVEEQLPPPRLRVEIHRHQRLAVKDPCRGAHRDAHAVPGIMDEDAITTLHLVAAETLERRADVGERRRLAGRMGRARWGEARRVMHAGGIATRSSRRSWWTASMSFTQPRSALVRYASMPMSKT